MAFTAISLLCAAALFISAANAQFLAYGSQSPFFSPQQPYQQRPYGSTYGNNGLYPNSQYLGSYSPYNSNQYGLNPYQRSNYGYQQFPYNNNQFGQQRPYGSNYGVWPSQHQTTFWGQQQGQYGRPYGVQQPYSPFGSPYGYGSSAFGNNGAQPWSSNSVVPTSSTTSTQSNGQSIFAALKKH